MSSPARLKNNPYAPPTFQFPANLGGEGQEPYSIFDVRQSVASDPKSLGTIALYIPASISVSYQANYQHSSFWEDWALGTKDSIGKGFNKMYDKTSGADVAGGIPSAVNEAWETAKATALNTSLRAQRAFGKIVNPHMSTLFQGMEFRTFNFSYSMMATSAEESDAIRDIIFTFKYHMVPGGNSHADFSRWLDYPENFVIGLFTPAGDRLFKIGACSLTNMTVEYNGSGIPAWFQNTGAPVEIHMNLTFQEHEILTKNSVANGY